MVEFHTLGQGSNVFKYHRLHPIPVFHFEYPYYIPHCPQQFLQLKVGQREVTWNQAHLMFVYGYFFMSIWLWSRSS